MKTNRKQVQQIFARKRILLEENQSEKKFEINIAMFRVVAQWLKCWHSENIPNYSLKLIKIQTRSLFFKKTLMFQFTNK